MRQNMLGNGSRKLFGNMRRLEKRLMSGKKHTMSSIKIPKMSCLFHLKMHIDQNPSKIL